MSLKTKNIRRKQRRKERTSSKIRRTAQCPRVSVYRSLKQFYGQIIDDAQNATVVSCSTLELENKSGDKKDLAKQVGLQLAKKATEKGIEKVALDRGSFLYHGRVKAFAEGLREGGLQV